MTVTMAGEEEETKNKVSASNNFIYLNGGSFRVLEGQQQRFKLIHKGLTVSHRVNLLRLSVRLKPQAANTGLL